LLEVLMTKVQIPELRFHPVPVQVF
jgi:hypothetical protein